MWFYISFIEFFHFSTCLTTHASFQTVSLHLLNCGKAEGKLANLKQCCAVIQFACTSMQQSCFFDVGHHLYCREWEGNCRCYRCVDDSRLFYYELPGGRWCSQVIWNLVRGVRWQVWDVIERHSVNSCLVTESLHAARWVADSVIHTRRKWVSRVAARNNCWHWSRCVAVRLFTNRIP